MCDNAGLITDVMVVFEFFIMMHYFRNSILRFRWQIVRRMFNSHSSGFHLNINLNILTKVIPFAMLLMQYVPQSPVSGAQQC